MWANDPSRRAVWHAVQSTPATRATTAVTEHELASDVAQALAPLTPGTPRERRTIMAEVIVHVAYSMLNFSIRDNQYRTDTVIELKRMLAAYLLAAEQSSATEESGGDAGYADGDDPGCRPVAVRAGAGLRRGVRGTPTRRYWLDRTGGPARAP